MRAAVIQFPGSNCDRDLKTALQRAAGARSAVEFVWHKDSRLPPKLDVIGIPGGFSYGDHLRCGAIAAHSPIMKSVVEFAKKGGYIIGICNGFQVLTEARLLPGTLMRNSGLRFLCTDVELSVETTDSAFTCLLDRQERIRLPIAHHDGNYRTDRETFNRLEGDDRIAFRYENNPNGSLGSVAGVLSRNRRILGIMPHPERRVDPMTGGTGGLLLFEGLVSSLASS